MNQTTRTLLDKLTSRKFLGSLLGVLVGLYVIFGLENTEAGVALIAASITGYNIGEAYVDGKSAESNTTQVVASSTSKELVQQLLDKTTSNNTVSTASGKDA